MSSGIVSRLLKFAAMAHSSRIHLPLGGVAERLIAPVLKTGRPKGLVSSNLTPSVLKILFMLMLFKLRAVLCRW